MAEDKFSPLGVDLFGDQVHPPGSGPLSQRYTVPPFTVLDRRQADWQHRKRMWLGQGIDGGSGREEQLLFKTTPDASFMHDKVMASGGSTSVFDPVIAELAYSWWCPEGGRIYDPFCGGSTRGIVAALLGYEYIGLDIRQEQIDANYEQWSQAHGDEWVRPNWQCGDSVIHGSPAPADFLFTCPPYGDLEVYSDLAGDISNMSWRGFLDCYYEAIDKAVRSLKPNRFAAFVVGDFRDKAGNYKSFPNHTVEAFELAGAKYYNEVIIINPVGSGAARAEGMFGSNRKLVKSHQQLLMF